MAKSRVPNHLLHPSQRTYTPEQAQAMAEQSRKLSLEPHTVIRLPNGFRVSAPNSQIMLGFLSYVKVIYPELPAADFDEAAVVLALRAGKNYDQIVSAFRAEFD